MTSPTPPSVLTRRVRYPQDVGRLLERLAAVGLVGCATERLGGGEGSDDACAALAETYGSFPEGTTVTIATPFSGEEAAAFDASLEAFAECTGITVVQEGSDTLEQGLRDALLSPTPQATGTAAPSLAAQTATPTLSGDEETVAATEAGTEAPSSSNADLAVVPQPGLIAELARAGLVAEMPEAVAANIELGWEHVYS